MRVLIAADERDFCQMLAEYLAPRGIEVVEASDGFETLRHVAHGAFDYLVKPVSSAISARASSARS